MVVAVKPRKWMRLWACRVKEGGRITYKEILNSYFMAVSCSRNSTWDGSQTVRDSLTPQVNSL